eukprot:498019-Pyramimonas_sp.AAC.2
MDQLEHSTGYESTTSTESRLLNSWKPAPSYNRPIVRRAGGGRGLTARVHRQLGEVLHHRDELRVRVALRRRIQTGSAIRRRIQTGSAIVTSCPISSAR